MKIIAYEGKKKINEKQINKLFQKDSLGLLDISEEAMEFYLFYGIRDNYRIIIK